MSEDGGRPGTLQVAIVRYAGEDAAGSFTVDLVSAVHIGERTYYAGLNERFRQYDALLYELIIPEQPEVPRTRGAPANLLSGTQVGLKNLLGLTFQLDEIDYDASNFVHADLTSSMLAQRMTERGESLYVYLWRVFYAAIEDYTRDPFGMKRSQRLAAVSAADPGNVLKVIMAHELVDAARGGDILAGPDGSALIDARNERAIQVLKDRLHAGARQLGIFYGVAHMPDLERRLLDELLLARTGTEWVDAWRLDDGRAPSSAP